MATRSTDTRLSGLEKTTAELVETMASISTMVNAMRKKNETFMAEVRTFMANNQTLHNDGGQSESHNSPTGSPPASPPLLMPTFDGTKALSWLARAEQFFLVSRTNHDDRLSLAMAALAGPALPWIQLLRLRIPSLSWERFTQELMLRFGDKVVGKARASYIGSTVHSVKDVDMEFNVPEQIHLPNYCEIVTAKVLTPLKNEVLDSLQYECNMETSMKPEQMLGSIPIGLKQLRHEKQFIEEDVKIAGSISNSAELMKIIDAAVSKTYLPKELCDADLPLSLACVFDRRRVHATGNKSSRYWFSGRGSLWKKRRGTFEGSFFFYLRLEGKAVSRVRQLIHRGRCIRVA